ncbi:MAG: FliH/SctL family protein [Defluviitaleaceae bacterium]|nr:FliH/SctL family protein [Defluviitaleaceae bacterium]
MSKRVIKNYNVTLDAQNIAIIENVIEIDGAQTEYQNNPSDYEHNQGDDEEKKAENIRQNAKSIMENATKQADNILEMAKAESEKILEKARKDTEQERNNIIMNAEKEGYNVGYDNGYEEGNKTAQGIIKNAKELKAQTEQERLDTIASLEPQMMQIVIQIIDKIAATNLRTNPSVILALIKQGFAEASYTGEVTLRVSKDDFDFVYANKDSILEFVEGGAHLEIVKDHSLNAADCLIETPFGVVDSSLTMQLDEIKQDIAQLL